MIPRASLAELALLALAGLVAGAVNTVAGAGSLLLLPALMWTGLSADAANATNRIGILAQTTMAVIGFRRAGLRPEPSEVRLVGWVMVGGVLGALVASWLSPDAMELAIVLAMLLMLAMSVAPRRATPTVTFTGPREVPLTPMLAIGLFGIGIYGGFLQAGLGIVLVLFLSRATSMDVVRANVLKSAATLGLTLVAMTVFYSAGETLDLWRGGALALGAAVGGLWGAKVTVDLGPDRVRHAITIAISAALLKMVYDLATR